MRKLSYCTRSCVKWFQKRAKPTWAHSCVFWIPRNRLLFANYRQQNNITVGTIFKCLLMDALFAFKQTKLKTIRVFAKYDPRWLAEKSFDFNSTQCDSEILMEIYKISVRIWTNHNALWSENNGICQKYSIWQLKTDDVVLFSSHMIRIQLIVWIDLESETILVHSNTFFFSSNMWNLISADVRNILGASFNADKCADKESAIRQFDVPRKSKLATANNPNRVQFLYLYLTQSFDDIGFIHIYSLIVQLTNDLPIIPDRDKVMSYWMYTSGRNWPLLLKKKGRT